MAEATFVFHHSNEAEARRFCMEIFERYPFGGDASTQVIAVAAGDAMSVADAVRMALLCRVLDFGMEQREFALAMCECNNWDDCLKLAEEWELRHEGGEFVDARPALAAAASGGDVEQAPGEAPQSGPNASEGNAQ